MNSFFYGTKDPIIEELLRISSDPVDMYDRLMAFCTNFVGDKQHIASTAKIASTAVIEGPVYIDENVVIDHFAVLKGPVIVLKNSVIGKGAFLRNGTIIGSDTVVGMSDEINNSIVMEHSLLPHFDIIDCSVIGSNVRMGAHVVTAVTTIHQQFAYKAIEKVNIPKEYFGAEYSRLLFGAVVGDNSKIASSVLINPGTFIEHDCEIYAGLCIKPGKYEHNTRLYIEGYYDKISSKKI